MTQQPSQWVRMILVDDRFRRWMRQVNNDIASQSPAARPSAAKRPTNPPTFQQGNWELAKGVARYMGIEFPLGQAHQDILKALILADGQPLDWRELNKKSDRVMGESTVK